MRLLTERCPEALVAVSFSKNLGLYRERVGALLAVGQSEERIQVVRSHMLHIARSIYSMPPDHGAAIAATILADAQLREAWVVELEAMRTRMADMRALLSDALRTATGERARSTSSAISTACSRCSASRRRWSSACARNTISTCSVTAV